MSATHYVIRVADERNTNDRRILCANCTAIELLYFGCIGSRHYGLETDDLIRIANELEAKPWAETVCAPIPNPPEFGCSDCGE
jgi:hypothetical protein